MALTPATAGTEIQIPLAGGYTLYIAKALPVTDGDTFVVPFTTIHSAIVSFADGATAAADSVAITYATNTITFETAGTVRTVQLWVICK